MQSSQNTIKAKSSVNIFFRKNIIQILMIGILVFLVFYRLQFYPQPWFDEGTHLLLAKEIAVGNGYPFDTTLGPTIIIPVALSMRLFGINLLPARITMAIYLLICVFSFYFLVKLLTGKKIALAASIMFVLSPGLDLIYMGRNVLGEVPGLVYFICGTLLFFKILQKENQKNLNLQLMLTGILFSLCVLSKYQFLILIPAWMLFSFINLVYYKKYPLKTFLIPFLIMCTISFAWMVLVNENVPKNAEQASQFLSRGILTFSPPHAKVSIKFLFSKDVYWGWFFPGFLYALFKSFSKKKEGIYWGWLVSITFGWISWFVLFSASWPRYAFVATTAGAIFVAALFSEITYDFYFPFKKILMQLKSSKFEAKIIPNFLIFSFLILSLGYEFFSLSKTIVSSGDESSLQMAAYIKVHVPSDEIIETYEPEMCFLSGANCHLPPSEIMDAAITHVWYSGPSPDNYYKLEDHLLPYLLIGEFNANIHLYPQTIIDKHYLLEFETGHYKLFKLSQN